MSRVPVSRVPVSRVPVSCVPVSCVPVSHVPVSRVPVSRVPVSRVHVCVHLSFLGLKRSKFIFYYFVSFKLKLEHRMLCDQDHY